MLHCQIKFEAGACLVHWWHSAWSQTMAEQWCAGIFNPWNPRKPGIPAVLSNLMVWYSWHLVLKCPKQVTTPALAIEKPWNNQFPQLTGKNMSNLSSMTLDEVETLEPPCRYVNWGLINMVLTSMMLLLILLMILMLAFSGVVILVIIVSGAIDCSWMNDCDLRFSASFLEQLPGHLVLRCLIHCPMGLTCCTSFACTHAELKVVTESYSLEKCIHVCMCSTEAVKSEAISLSTWFHVCVWVHIYHWNLIKFRHVLGMDCSAHSSRVMRWGVRSCV